MKEKISLKRQTRRCKSESLSKEPTSSSSTSCSNNNGKLMKDGKEICPIPLVDCICPGQPVNEDKPAESVKMLCSNHSCYFAKKAYVHMECFKALEEQMYILLKHLGHKTANWTDTQIRQNLWDRKGLTLIQTQIRCPCGGGISLRDEDAWIHREKQTEKIEKKRKSKKKKDLPSVITRARCESETAPPQYDSHDADEIFDPNISKHLSKIRLEKSGTSKKGSRKPLTNFKLDKPPEVEFPAIGNRARAASVCETGIKKMPAYNEVASNGISPTKRILQLFDKSIPPVDSDGMSHSSAPTNFTTSSSNNIYFNRAPGTPVWSGLNAFIGDSVERGFPYAASKAAGSFVGKKLSSARASPIISQTGAILGSIVGGAISSSLLGSSSHIYSSSYTNDKPFYERGLPPLPRSTPVSSPISTSLSSSTFHQQQMSSLSPRAHHYSESFLPTLSRSTPLSTSSSSSAFHQMPVSTSSSSSTFYQHQMSNPSSPRAHHYSESHSDNYHTADEEFDPKWDGPPTNDDDDSEGYQLFK